jgi:hypothetical protein
MPQRWTPRQRRPPHECWVERVGARQRPVPIRGAASCASRSLSSAAQAPRLSGRVRPKRCTTGCSTNYRRSQTGRAHRAPAAAPATATAAGAATATPAAAAASIAGPTPTPYPVANFGSSSAKVAIRYWTILGSVGGIGMNELVRKFADANPGHPSRVAAGCRRFRAQDAGRRHQQHRARCGYLAPHLHRAIRRQERVVAANQD